MPDNSGLEKAVLYDTDAGRLYEVADWIERRHPDDAGADEAADSLRGLAGRLKPFQTALSTGELVERERLLSADALEAVVKRRDPLYKQYTKAALTKCAVAVRLDIEAALHTATQSKEGRDG